jgi:hypothetical protein
MERNRLQTFGLLCGFLMAGPQHLAAAILGMPNLSLAGSFLDITSVRNLTPSLVGAGDLGSAPAQSPSAPISFQDPSSDAINSYSNPSVTMDMPVIAPMNFSLPSIILVAMPQAAKSTAADTTSSFTIPAGSPSTLPRVTTSPSPTTKNITSINNADFPAPTPTDGPAMLGPTSDPPPTVPNLTPYQPPTGSSPAGAGIPPVTPTDPPAGDPVSTPEPASVYLWSGGIVLLLGRLASRRMK